MIAGTARTLPVCLLTLLVVNAVMPSTLEQQAANAQEFRKYPVKYNNQSFEVQASLPEGATIESIEVFPDSGSIFLTLEMSSVQNAGTLEIVLPRDLIDAKNDDGTDSTFNIFVDDEETDYSELSSTATERKLSIPVPEGSSDVEIFGSQIVPEFTLGLGLSLSLLVIMLLGILFHRRNFTRASFPPTTTLSS
jgi:hypothetical protein